MLDAQAMLTLGLVVLAFSSFVIAHLATDGNPKTKRSLPITYPLKRAGQARTPRAIYEADVARIQRLYGPGDEKTRKRSTTLPLGNLNQDAMYYATLQIGTPPQHMDVQMDSGSSDLWVYTNDCQNCKPTSPLPWTDGTQQYFNKSKSSTIYISNTQVGITYGGGSGVSGVVATETIGLGACLRSKIVT